MNEILIFTIGLWVGGLAVFFRMKKYRDYMKKVKINE